MKDTLAMNCHDAREGVSRAGMGLTERALVHAHVMQCAECRKERDALPLLVVPPQRVAPSRAARLTRLRTGLSTSLTLSGQASERAAVNAIGAARFGMTHLAHRGTWLRRSLMITFQWAARVVIASALAGVGWVLDLLTRVRGVLSALVKRSERAAANAIGATRFGMTHLAHLGSWLRRSLMIAFQWATRGAIGSAIAGAARILDLLTRVRGLLSALAKRSERAAANAIGATRFGMTHLAHLGSWLRRSLMITFQWAARVAIGSAIVGAARILDLLTRVGGLLSVLVKRSERAAVDLIRAARFGMTHFARLVIRLRVLLSTVSVRAGGRVIAASLGEARRVLDLLTRARRLFPLLFRWSGRAAVRATGAARGVGQIVVTTMGGALSLLGARVSPMLGARPLLKVCTGIVSLVVLVATILALWPRQGPDDLMARARVPAGERLSRDVRRPVDRNPAEVATAAPLVKTSAPKPTSAPEPAPVEVSPPETPRVATRRKSPGTQTEIPAPKLTSAPEPAPVEVSPPETPRVATQRRSPGTQTEIPAPVRTSASAPMPTEAAPSAETSDSTAAIDWLLQGGGSRRRIETP